MAEFHARPHLARLRDRFGEEFAELIEELADLALTRREMPRARDIQTTLQTAAAAPRRVPLRRLDGWTEARLVTAAVRLFGTVELASLSAEQVGQCARQALAAERRGSGRTRSDDLAAAAAVCVRDWADANRLGREERLAALADALLAIGIAASDSNLKRLTDTGRFFGVRRTS